MKWQNITLELSKVVTLYTAQACDVLLIGMSASRVHSPVAKSSRSTSFLKLPWNHNREVNHVKDYLALPWLFFYKVQFNEQKYIFFCYLLKRLN